MPKCIKYLCLVLLFCCQLAGAESAQTLVIPSQIALPIGIKIWFNECGGRVDGLTSWNDGENFASLGIGHFIWAPYPGHSPGGDSFSQLITYMEKHGTKVPLWLRNGGARYCPWANRTEFLRAQYTSQMVELRHFLRETIQVQAQYMAHQLEQTLPQMLASVPPNDRPYICKQFYNLAHTPSGIYALVDYLNFKGGGTRVAPAHFERGSGLLQVLANMKYAPHGMSPMEAYVWSAKNALIRRIENASPSMHTERWLAGWFKRINTYLEGDIPSQYAVNKI